jgi:hypothetical protein
MPGGGFVGNIDGFGGCLLVVFGDRSSFANKNITLAC